jgi:hypothetical protein
MGTECIPEQKNNCNYCWKRQWIFGCDLLISEILVCVVTHLNVKYLLLNLVMKWRGASAAHLVKGKDDSSKEESALQQHPGGTGRRYSRYHPLPENITNRDTVQCHAKEDAQTGNTAHCYSLCIINTVKAEF